METFGFVDDGNSLHGAGAAEPQSKRWQYLYVGQQWVKFEPIGSHSDGPRLI
jgi:hypothetical protein